MENKYIYEALDVKDKRAALLLARVFGRLRRRIPSRLSLSA